VLELFLYVIGFLICFGVVAFLSPGTALVAVIGFLLCLIYAVCHTLAHRKKRKDPFLP